MFILLYVPPDYNLKHTVEHAWVALKNMEHLAEYG